MLSLAASTLLSVIWLISNLMKYSRQMGKAAEESTPQDIAEAWGRRRKVGLSLACLFVYIIALPWIGFILSSVLFILAFVLVLDERRKAVLIISPLLITAVVIIVFGKFITMPLPKGVGVFAEFSRLFY